MLYEINGLEANVREAARRAAARRGLLRSDAEGEKHNKRSDLVDEAAALRRSADIAAASFRRYLDWLNAEGF